MGYRARGETFRTVENGHTGAGSNGAGAGMQDDWQSRARCRGLESEQFFVRGSTQARHAIAVCDRCTVRAECLRYAVENRVDFGVWGGMTERQRRAYQRRLAS